MGNVSEERGDNKGLRGRKITAMRRERVGGLYGVYSQDEGIITKAWGSGCIHGATEIVTRSSSSRYDIKQCPYVCYRCTKMTREERNRGGKRELYIAKECWLGGRPGKV